MGTWGYKLYDSDEALDRKDEFTLKLKQGKSKEELIKEMIEENQESIENEEDAPIFWFTLADLLWKNGKLTDEVKKKAIEYLDKGGDLDAWKEDGTANEYKKRKEVLDNLREKLESKQPEERIIKVRKPYCIPWKIGDIFAYKLTQEQIKGTEYEGKYVVFQMVETFTSQSADTYGDILPFVVFFDRIFDEIPKLEELENIKYLILATPETSLYVEIKPIYKMLFYSLRERTFSKENLVYIGNNEVKEYNKTKEYKYEVSSKFDQWIVWRFKYNSLDNVDKNLLVDKNITSVKEIVNYIDEEEIGLLKCSLDNKLKAYYFIIAIDEAKEKEHSVTINTFVGRINKSNNEMEAREHSFSKEKFREIVMDLKDIRELCAKEFNVNIGEGDYFKIEYKYDEKISDIICKVQFCRALIQKVAFLTINAISGKIIKNEGFY
ncbi:MAG: hypothetical protein PHP54_02545 [Clostridia bacterium]|nr:hypothetical protein [Clostridia bacterium]